MTTMMKTRLTLPTLQYIFSLEWQNIVNCYLVWKSKQFCIDSIVVSMKTCFPWLFMKLSYIMLRTSLKVKLFGLCCAFPSYKPWYSTVERHFQVFKSRWLLLNSVVSFRCLHIICLFQFFKEQNFPVILFYLFISSFFFPTPPAHDLSSLSSQK